MARKPKTRTAVKSKPAGKKKAIAQTKVKAKAKPVRAKPAAKSKPASIKKAAASKTPDLTIVIPVFNERESLPELHERITEEVGKLKLSFETIYIDDGSTDGSFEVIQALPRGPGRVRAVRFRKNYGKSAALNTGFRMMEGQYVITMDSDLQDDPAEIGNLVAKLKEGFDMVSGWKKKRNDPITKTIPSRFFNMVTRFFSGIKLHDFNCGLKGYTAEAIRSIDLYGELHRYIPILAKQQGFNRITEIQVRHHARKYGYSKFGLSRFVKGFLDLLTMLFLSRYVRRPLHLFGLIGTLCFLIGLIISVYLTVGWFQGMPLYNRPILLLGVLLILVGIQVVSIGLVGELIAHHNNRNQPPNISEQI